MFRPPIWSIAAASALLGALLPPTASGHAGGEHPLTWVLEESCVPADSTHADDPDWAGGEELRNLPVAKPRLAGRFRSEAPRAVTVVLRSNASGSTVKAQVKRSGRFAVDLRSMPGQIRLRWDDNGGVLHATRWSGRLHAGCNDPGPAPPPGTPAGWVPSYPLGCGDSGPPCPPPAWVPPPISSE